MVTLLEEATNAIEALSDEAFTKFKLNFGGDGQTREWYVDEFERNPLHRNRMCVLLGIKTEAERDAEVQQKQINLQKENLRVSHGANKLSLAALVIGILALIVSAFAVYVSMRP